MFFATAPYISVVATVQLQTRKELFRKLPSSFSEPLRAYNLVMKIPFGMRRSDNRMVGPELVSNGLSCDCVCSSCGLPLISKQGKIKEWHFAHASGAECSHGVESAIHKMAKQMIMDRGQVCLPQFTLYRPIQGATWSRQLNADVQAGGLIELLDCREEVKLEARTPDILATMPNGQPLAIEVAFKHFCDQEKIEWIKRCNLTTLEIDIFIPPSTPANEISKILEERLFTATTNAHWLHHAGEAQALVVLNENERAIREQHADADAAHEAREAAEKAKQKRKAEFLEKVRDIKDETLPLGRDLTLRIAQSKTRVTMKAHGYFKNASPQVKQMIFEAANHFGGQFNTKYNVWEFWPPESNVVSFYDELRHFIYAWKEQKPPVPPKPELKPKVSPIISRPFMDLGEEELFEERAAIMESEGGLTRAEAEKLAYVEITGRHQ